MNKNDDDDFTQGYDKIPVRGKCDAGCGQPATTWFNMTACATCGSELCIARMQRDYDAHSGLTRAPDHPGVERRLRGTVPVTGTITDSGGLLPLSVPTGHAIVLWPNDIAEYAALQLAVVDKHAALMMEQDSLVAATFTLGEIRGRLLALQEIGLFTDEQATARGEAIKARYMEQWRGVFDAAMEDDK